jgi:hypothetical protein
MEKELILMMGFVSELWQVGGFLCIRFVSELWQVGGFLCITFVSELWKVGSFLCTRVYSTYKTDGSDIAKLLLKMALTIMRINSFSILSKI